MSYWARTLGALVSLTMLTTAPATGAATDSARPVDPGREAANYAKQTERASDYLTPAMLRQQTVQGSRSAVQGLRQQADDPGRMFLTDLCWAHEQGCGGDPRLASWKRRGYGRMRPVLFTGRNGATLSGHVWATRRGPAHRPVVVITSGSVQATEQMYWWAAQVLAKAGYVVLTWDAQNQGRSDTTGDGGDRLDGVPTQLRLTTFFDHTQDALDFALSRPEHAYCPRPSRSGARWCGKQRSRAADGLANGYNPMWRLVDRRRVGLAGHSYGASGASWIGQQDRRVDAVVAWDNLCNPALERRPSAPLSSGNAGPSCPTAARGSARPRVPSLGISGDYPGTPLPYRTEPDAGAKSIASRQFSRAGVDTGQVVIRGGTHYEWSYIPAPAFGATLRGIDASAWYTTAWMDRYVKGDRTATRRLLTTRWRHDGVEGTVDPAGDGNMFSYHYRSRLDLGHHGGRRVRCENLRRGCTGLVTRDGRGPSYSYLAIATSRDR